MSRYAISFSARLGMIPAICAIVLLSACQQTAPPEQSSISSKRPVTQTAITSQNTQSNAPARPQTDIVGDLISQIEEDAGSALITQTDENSEQNLDETDEVMIASLPQQGAEQEPISGQASEALDAALSLLKQRTKPQQKPVSSYIMPLKQDDHIRVGVFLPLSGDFRQLGLDIAAGVDFAFFQTGLKQVELVYFDTAGGRNAAQAASHAVEAGIDISIGPLFSTSINAIGPIMSAYNIPVLSLSNNLSAADSGRWVLGYLPEQQMDNLLAYAIEQNKTKIAILASQDDFGQKIRQHVEKRLRDFAITPSNITILDQATLDDEELLKANIKSFTGYIPPTEEDNQLPPALYDTVVLAGNPDFILRTAPVLDYYDLGPSRVTFLGTDLWSRTELVTEPSLQGALVTQAVLPDTQNFNRLWKQHFPSQPSPLARLGFDVMAVVALTASQELSGANTDHGKIDWRKSLLRDKGFAGFSGRFSLLPDGRNQRQYQIKQINDGKLSSPLEISS